MPEPTTPTRNAVCGGGGETSEVQRLTEELKELKIQRFVLAERKRECTLDSDDRNNGAAENIIASFSQINKLIILCTDSLKEALGRDGASNGTVKIGSIVTVLNHQGSKCIFTITSRGDTGRDHITIDSLMGQALVGSRPGDKIKIFPPKGPMTWTLLRVSQ